VQTSGLFFAFGVVPVVLTAQLHPERMPESIFLPRRKRIVRGRLFAGFSISIVEPSSKVQRVTSAVSTLLFMRESAEAKSETLVPVRAMKSEAMLMDTPSVGSLKVEHIKQFVVSVSVFTPSRGPG